jgi:hypothetical protein
MEVDTAMQTALQAKCREELARASATKEEEASWAKLLDEGKKENAKLRKRKKGGVSNL